jgi:Zn-dependent protease with chaperone function
MRMPRPLFLAFAMALALAAPPASAGQNPPQATAAQSPATQSTPAQPIATQASPQQAYSLPPDKLAKAIALDRIRNILEFAGSLWGIAFLWLLLASRAAARLAAWAERIAPRRWLQGLLFFAVLLVILSLANLPLDWYGEHVSLRYGISVQGWPSWLADQAKALALSVLIGAPVMLLFHWIVRRWPRRYWFGAWAAAVPLIILVAFASPFFEPIFDKFEPLSKTDPALVAQLEKVVARTGTNIPASRMFLMKASAKTNGLNAYVSGLGATKRVVVWDTTAGRIPNDEILFIFGHESGHYVLHHIPKMIAGTAIGLFFVFWACAGFANWLAARCAVRWGLTSPDHSSDPQPPLATRAGFVVLLFVVSIAGFLLEPAANAFSRYFEHQADIYGQEAIHGIVPDPQKTTVAAFNALGQAWLEDPDPNPFIEFWTDNHPSVKQRADFAAHYDPWADGGHGKYFTH